MYVLGSDSITGTLQEKLLQYNIFHAVRLMCQYFISRVRYVGLEGGCDTMRLTSMSLPSYTRELSSEAMAAELRRFSTVLSSLNMYISGSLLVCTTCVNMRSHMLNCKRRHKADSHHKHVRHEECMQSSKAMGDMDSVELSVQVLHRQET